MNSSRRYGWHLAALLGYALLALMMTWPLARQLGSAIPGDSFDGWQNLWNLWWMREAWLVRHISPYATDMLFAPTGVDLRFQTMAPFNGLAFMNVNTALGVIPAYNAASLFSFVAGGYSAFLLALYALRDWATRARTGSLRTALYGAAFVGGIIYTFSPYHFAHLLGHLQLITLEWIPFYVLFLLRGLDRAAAPHATWRMAVTDGLMAGLFLALVGLSDWYYVMYCLIFTALALVIWLIRRKLSWRGVVTVAVAGGFFGLFMAPLLLPMVAGARAWGGPSLLRDYSETLTLSADLLAFVTPQVLHPLWGDLAMRLSAGFTATPSEFTVFAGFAVLILTGIALLATRTGRKTDVDGAPSSSPWLYALGAGLFALFSLGPVLKINGNSALLPGGGQIPLPYRILYETVPFIKLSRSVSRMDVMVMLLLGVAAAFGVYWLSSRAARRWPAAAWLTPLLAGGLILLEFLPAPYPVSPPDTPAWYETLAQDPAAGAVYNLPANYERPGYLLYQITHGKPMVNGYVTRDDPSTLRERAPVMSQFWFLGPDINTVDFDLAGQGEQVLHDLLGVRWVVLDRYKMPGGSERETTEAMADQIFGDRSPLYEDERITVLTVEEPAQRSPFVVLGADWRARQLDEAGAPWRELPAGRAAGIELISPAAWPVSLEITASAPEGTLHLADEHGAELASWPLSASTPLMHETELDAEPGMLLLRFEGPPDSHAVVTRIEAR